MIYNFFSCTVKASVMHFNITILIFRISISWIQNRFCLSTDFTTIISAFEDFLSSLNWTTILSTASQNTHLSVFMKMSSQCFLSFIAADRFLQSFENNWSMMLMKFLLKKKEKWEYQKTQFLIISALFATWEAFWKLAYII